VFSGIGVHSGLPATMRILPAPENFGIVFKRTDIKEKNNIVESRTSNVITPTMCTKITNEAGVSVGVIEHLMAAFRISGITNAFIEIDAEEVPIIDGSSIEFVNAFTKAGINRQNAKVKTIVIKQQISEQFDTSSFVVTPANDCILSIFLNYERINRIIKNNNSTTFKMSAKKKLMKIAESRTFGWLEDYDKVRKAGMARGSSADNTIIIGPNDSVINREGLRNEKEIVNHKALDLIGDFFVFGCDIIGHITAVNPSHFNNHAFITKLITNFKSGEIFEEKIPYTARIMPCLCEEVSPASGPA
jgi:UDP-3-O-[3-hydroxymyristoyl] N-acetylglucosamine deacetylase